MIDTHHHLRNLSSVYYPRLMAHGVKRFFGDPTPIWQNHLIDEVSAETAAQGITASVHIRVGAAASLAEAGRAQSVVDAQTRLAVEKVVILRSHRAGWEV